MIGELFGVDQATASRAINRVTKALLRQLAARVCLPSQEEADIQKQKFHAKAGFPNVIGCIDGTHVRILAPSNNEHEYVNRKNFHSINVQVRTNRLPDFNLSYCGCAHHLHYLYKLIPTIYPQNVVPAWVEHGTEFSGEKFTIN